MIKNRSNEELHDDDYWDVFISHANEDKEEIARNTAKVDRLQELIKNGMSPDDAVKKVKEENLNST